MLKTLKYLLYFLIALGLIFLYWFLPKYSFIHKNPGYCVNLTKHIYYCGNAGSMDKLFGAPK